MKGWLDKYDDSIVAQGGETISSSREIPEITVYGKKNYLQELDKQQQKYLADMAKFKQDSTQWVKANQAYQDSLALYKDTEGIRYNSDKFKGHTFISAEEAEKAKKEDRFMFYDLNPHLDPAYEYDSGELGELRDKIKPIGYIGADIRKDPVYGPAGARFYASLPIYKKPTIPTPPAKPTGTNVEYDPTYENLQMRPLWATMAKQDTTAKIGTLNPLDPLYEKGFTYGEAQKFPEEIRRQYKLDYPIYQNGGEITREDYLRQQHQNYLKSQAEKGRKAVTDATDKFSRDYVIPAIKTVGSFTPAGPLIGLADAYEAYQQGNTGWALAGAGIEALPYVGKGVGKGIKALSNIVTDNKNAIKLAYYNKAPWTWKPNESAYYHRSPEITNIVNKETKTLQGFGASEAGKKYSEMATPGLHGKINLVKPANSTLHYSKGVPLDWGRYNLSGQGYAGPYMLEVENVPMRATTQGRVKSFAPTKKEAYASSERPVSLDEVNFYKEHPIFGYKKIKPQFQTGGTIPKAQEGTTLQRPYIAKQDATKVLLPLTKKVNQEENEYYNPPIEKGITSGDKRLDFLYNNQWLFDVPIVNDYIRKNAKELASISALGMVDDVEEFKELAKKNNLSYSGHGPGKGLISQYFDQDAFPPSKYKPTSDYLTFLPSYSLKANFESDFTKAQRDDYVSSFIKEGLTSKNDVIATEIPYNDFIKNKKPVYNRYPHANLVSLGNPDLGGHKMGAAWDYTVDLPYVSISDAWDFEPVHYTKAWAAYESEPERQKRRIQSTLLHKAGHPFKIYDRFYFDPKTKEYISDDSIQTLKREKGITPLEDEFLNKDISKYFTDEQSLKKFAEGGSMSYTPEYIEQLKQFENRRDNLAYHLDNKKIPTIGWGHRITEEELKRKAIKVGKEWVPYEKFSGKEGRQYADRLMELDVAHHYNRLERQVGKDTLATLPPEVHDVLLDITYNRGSLGDSLEYVKSGDIAGLRDYLADVSKGLKGGAKTRMEWRANRIPIKTLPPVEAPINYNVENQYVPEVLQSIAEQPSTQDIIPIQDNEGYRNQENYGKPVQITSNRPTTSISMDQVPFPILAMSDTGELKIMFPGEEHEFEGGSVTEVPMAQEGARIKSDDRNWLERFNDKVYSGYQEHKPQLFKDFPITDIVEPVVSYLTGHSDPDTGLMNILPGANLPNKYYRRLTEGQISKAIREKGLITPTLKEKGLTVTKSFPKKGQYVLELSTNKPVSANPLSISYGKTHPSQTYSFPDIVDLQSGNMKMFRRLNKKLIEVDPKLYGAPSKEALIDKQVIESMSPASGSLPYHHYAGEETLLSPHKIYKGGQNPPQLSLDRDYIYGIEKFKRNKSKINYADPSRSDEVSSPHIVNDYKRPSYVNLYDNSYYASTEPSANSLTPLSKNIQEYVGNFSDEISPQFRSPQMINSVRSYYKNHFGEDVSMLSNEDISKFIQKSYNESGAKGVLYHSTNRPMTEYNPNYPTEERINPGWLGEGTYFADIPSQDYGLLQEPFIHSGIEKKAIINDIRDFKNPTVRFTSPQIEVDNLLKKISKPIVRKDKGGLSYEGNPTAFGIGKNREIWNKFIKDRQVDAIYSATSTKGVGMNWPEIVIPPSSSVNLRSLYPHPELIKSSLNRGRLNRDWSNPMINYEDGGNIKKSKQLRTFTGDSGWLNKYKEQ